MTDWTLLAAALDPPLPAEARESAVQNLASLEASLEALSLAVPVATLPWRNCAE